MLTWHGKEPATSLLMSSLFRDNLVSVLCWRLWPGSEQPGGGHLLSCWSVWGGEVHHENSCQESREGDTPSPLSSWPSSYLPLKWHEGHSPVGRAQHSSLGPREQRRLSLTPTGIKSQRCHFPSYVTWGKSLNVSVLQVPPLQIASVTIPPSSDN